VEDRAARVAFLSQYGNIKKEEVLYGSGIPISYVLLGVGTLKTGSFVTLKQVV